VSLLFFDWLLFTVVFNLINTECVKPIIRAGKINCFVSDCVCKCNKMKQINERKLNETKNKQQSDHLTIWPCDNLIMWPFDHVTMWPCDHLTMWQCDHLTIWPFDHLTIWPCDHVTMWPFDHVTIWLCDHLTMWSCDHVTIWPCDHLTMWPFDHLTMWPFDYVTMWPCDHLTMWPFDHLTMWPFDYVTISSLGETQYCSAEVPLRLCWDPLAKVLQIFNTTLSQINIISPVMLDRVVWCKFICTFTDTGYLQL